MRNLQNILDKIYEIGLDSTVNIARTKLLYSNNSVSYVPDEYVASTNERVFWFEKVNGTIYLEEIVT